MLSQEWRDSSASQFFIITSDRSYRYFTHSLGPFDTESSRLSRCTRIPPVHWSLFECKQDRSHRQRPRSISSIEESSFKCSTDRWLLCSHVEYFVDLWTARRDRAEWIARFRRTRLYANVSEPQPRAIQYASVQRPRGSPSKWTRLSLFFVELNSMFRYSLMVPTVLLRNTYSKLNMPC